MASKFLCVGPGGVRCACCFPAPGSKHRKRLIRTAKRREAREAARLERLNNDKEEDDNDDD